MENINIFPHFYKPLLGSADPPDDFSQTDFPDFSRVPFLTCGTFYYYVFAESQERDIILGTDQGDLAVVTFSKFSVVKKNAHEAMINIVR